VYPANLDYRSLLADIEGLVPAHSGVDTVGLGLPSSQLLGSLGGMVSSPSDHSRASKKGKGFELQLTLETGAAAAVAPTDFEILEALLEGDPPPILVARGAGAGGKEGKGTRNSASANEASEEGGMGFVDAVALAKAAQEAEEAAAQAAAARVQRQVAREASAHALLLQLEMRADEAFRAHEMRVWTAAHPNTASSLEASTQRLRQLQAQLGQVYEQIRAEHAQTLQLRAQIEARTAPTTTAAALRAESMLDVALKTARSSIILAAAAHDGGGEGAIDTEGANDPESISP